MKALFLTLIIVWSGVFHSILAQQNSNKFLIEEYLQQSEKQKKTGWTMIGVGAAALGLGTVIAFASNDLESTGFATGGILFIAGGASTILGIPVLISSSAKARKAARLSLGTETVSQINSDMIFSGKSIPSLTLSIPLNSLKQ